MSRRLARGGPPDETLRAMAFELSPWPALAVAADGRLLAANEAAERLFGQGLALLTRGRFEEALPPASGLVRLLQRAREARAVVRDHGLEVVLFGQPPFTADAAATPLPEGAVLLTLNIRTAFERTGEMRDSPALVGLGRMLAHEIKNPLAGIRGAAQLLRGDVPAEDAPLAQLIVDETDRITRLIDRMESFADPAEPRELQPVNIHAVLDRVRALAENGFAAGLRVREQFDPSLPPVLGDEDQLIQLFLNLGKNAAEAAHARDDDQGELLIATAFRHGVRVKAGQGAYRTAPLEVRVQDNGPGVPDRLRDHLFEPFVTTKPHGAGLGLPLVAKLVASHGGLLDFESEPGRTVFSVRLPVAAAGLSA
jgi:two-component system, NtrC family, nitrogen regulation sensor histidine kinase GlnL